MSTVRIQASGDCTSLHDLVAALASLPGAQLVDERPDVILLGASGTTFSAARLAGMSVPVVLGADNASPALLEQALRAGVADVVLLPQPAESVLYTLRKAASAARLAQAGECEGRVVTVFSPKGGTGKSVTATNLATAFAAAGKRTLLLDFDLQFGDAAIMLGVDALRTVHDLAAAASELDSDKLSAYAARTENGLDVLAAPLRPEEAELITEDQVGRILDVAASAYEVTVVDTSPYFHAAMLATLDRTSDLLLVCTPDVPTLKNVRLALQTLSLLSLPDERIRLVLNRPNTHQGLSRRDVSSVLERRVDFELPNDPAVVAGINRGNPTVASAPTSPYTEALQALACDLLEIAPEAGRPAPQGLRRLVLRASAA